MNKPITKMSDIPKSDLVIGGISVVFLISAFFYVFTLNKDLSKRPAYTKGIIVDKDIRLKGNPFIIYNFTVEDIIYRGSTRYSHSIQEINIGDTCYVVYEEGEPNNNRLLKDEKDERFFKITKPYVNNSK